MTNITPKVIAKMLVHYSIGFNRKLRKHPELANSIDSESSSRVNIFKVGGERLLKTIAIQLSIGVYTSLEVGRDNLTNQRWFELADALSLVACFLANQTFEQFGPETAARTAAKLLKHLMKFEFTTRPLLESLTPLLAQNNAPAVAECLLSVMK